MKKLSMEQMQKAFMSTDGFHVEVDPTREPYVNDIRDFIGEAAHTMALDFFNIEVQKHYIILPDNFNVNDAIETVNGYFDMLDDEEGFYNGISSPTYAQKIRDYDNHTKPHRGADDGTYDYAGSYMIMILQCIKILDEHFKEDYCVEIELTTMNELKEDDWQIQQHWDWIKNEKFGVCEFLVNIDGKKTTITFEIENRLQSIFSTWQMYQKIETDIREYENVDNFSISITHQKI